MNLRNSEFIEAARCYGTRSPRIIFKHLLPNLLGPLIVTTFMSLGTVILCIAAMGYLGIGVQAPTPEWGSICLLYTSSCCAGRLRRFLPM